VIPGWGRYKAILVVDDFCSGSANLGHFATDT
jgi:hypothetical protein